jgi:hypothetical protein
MQMDPETGALTATDSIVDAGGQASLGLFDIARLSNGLQVVVYTDRDTTAGRGMCSAILNQDGTFEQRSLRIDGGGVDPFESFAWVPPGPTCGTSDFNGDDDFGTDQDIEAFFACLAGFCCPTCFPGGADFNGDGDTGTDQDIEAFFRVLAGGSC